MKQNKILIELLKYQLPSSQYMDKTIFDYVTVAKISTEASDQVITLMTNGQIDTIEQRTLLDGKSIIDAICRLNPKAIEKTNNSNHEYCFKVPIHFKWGSDFCPPVDENNFRQVLQSSSQTILCADLNNLNKQFFSISALFEEEVSFETKYENTEFFLDLKVRGIFSKGVFINSFKGNIDFSDCVFKEKVEMKNLQCFSIDCSQSLFNSCLEVRKSSFEKDANFYNAVFKMAPIFSEVIFEKNANFINTKMDFTFYQLKDLIEEQVKRKYPHITWFLWGSNNYQKDKEKSEYREKISSDFQDSFRLLKNTLAKCGNTLESTIYHKLELYAKEIGLKGVEYRTIQAIQYEDGFKNVALIGKIIDRWQLAFYRHLSDHHTSLLKVFNNLMIVMMTCFLTKNFLNKENLSATHQCSITLETIKTFLTQHSLSFLIGKGLVWLMYLPIIYLAFKLCKIVVQRRRSMSFTSILIEEIKILFLSLFYYLILTTPTIAFIILGKEIVEYIPFIKLNIDVTPIVILILLGNIPIAFISTQSILLRMCLIFCSYIIFLCLILPNLGSYYGDIIEFAKNSKNKDTILVVLTLFYAFLQTIVLWSLQKTARKNSIVPN